MLDRCVVLAILAVPLVGWSRYKKISEDGRRRSCALLEILCGNVDFGLFVIL